MQHKGYLTDEGRVVDLYVTPADPGHRRAGMIVDRLGSPIVGEVHYDEQRYNLRRVLVSRTWYVTPHPKPADDHRRIRERAIAAGSTRGEAIAAALRILNRTDERNPE